MAEGDKSNIFRGFKYVSSSSSSSSNATNNQEQSNVSHQIFWEKNFRFQV
jgi:hypothetical protein